jgi:hypothetical protein
MREVDTSAVEQVLNEFCSLTGSVEGMLVGGTEYVKKLLAKALDPEKVELILSNLSVPTLETGLEALRWLDPKTIARFLRNEHPHFEIDQKQEIPEWCVKRLFDLGVMGMIIPREYGGGGFGVASYNRVLERIGMSCGSTAVMVSAHQSIGCGALVLPEQITVFRAGEAFDEMDNLKEERAAASLKRGVVRLADAARELA